MATVPSVAQLLSSLSSPRLSCLTELFTSLFGQFLSQEEMLPAQQKMADATRVTQGPHKWSLYSKGPPALPRHE